MSGSFELQKAIKEKLSNDAAIQLSVTGVFDYVEQDQEFPYITIGEDTLIPFDTDGETGTEATITIHCWSQHRGRAEVKQIQQLIYNALNRGILSIEGYTFVSCDCEFATSFRDADGLTFHGVQRFRIIFEEVN